MPGASGPNTHRAPTPIGAPTHTPTHIQTPTRRPCSVAHPSWGLLWVISPLAGCRAAALPLQSMLPTAPAGSAAEPGAAARLLRPLTALPVDGCLPADW